MRQIGSLSDQIAAERFVDYLTTIDVSSHCEEDGGEWLIWIKDENLVESAREELGKFLADPEARIYQQAKQQAHEIRSEVARQRIQAHKNFHHARDAWNAPLSKRAPTVFALIVTCIALAVMGGGSVFGEEFGMLDRYLMFSFHGIRAGQLWRIVTPALLHGGPFHLAFNMYWVYMLGAQIEAKIGRWSFLGLTLAGAAFPNLLQAFLVGPNFLGISGVVFAYFGYIIVRLKDGYILSTLTIYIILGFFILDLAGVGFYSNVAIWAHAGGLITGVVIGYARDWNKLRPRR